MKERAFLALVAMIATPFLATPVYVAAQPYDGYGSYDPCREARREAGTNGAIAGGALGAVLGSAVAGRDSRLGGALVGGTVGALAGHEIGRSSVRCLAYPRRFRARASCRWVEQDWRGRPHQFELCRAPDGVWRPSGRRLY